MKLSKIKYAVLVLIAAFLLQSNAFALSPEHSGSWYYPEQSGHGLSFEVGELGDGTPYVLAYWYVYDSNGSPLFLVGQGYPGDYGAEVEFTVSWGMAFGEFDPDTVNRAPAGVGKFTFQNEQEGTFEYFPSDWSVENLGHSAINVPITKLFAVSMPDPEIIEVPVPVGGNALVSQIYGNFDGWDGDTIFELVNGQVWQQAEYKYQYFYLYQPDIVIYEKYGSYYASVDTFGSGAEHVRVQRIR